jgi:hypothetical protein
MLRCKQFGNIPHVVSQSSFHGWSDTKRLVYPAKIVIGEVQRTRGLEIVQLLAESVRQPSEPANRHPHVQILPLNVAGADVTRVRPTVPYLDYGFDYLPWRVAAFGVMLPVIAVQLYHLSEVRLPCEYILDATAVEVEAVSRKLEAVFFRDAAMQVIQEPVRGFAGPLAYGVRGNQLCVCVNSNEYPSVAKLRRIAILQVTFLLAYERPNFVTLNPGTPEIAHLRVHQSYAAFASKNQEPEDSVTVQLGDALGAANAGSLNQQLNRRERLIFRNCHRAKQTAVRFRIGLAAEVTAKPLKAIAVLPELPAFVAATRAIHVCMLQRALAVCQAKKVAELRIGGGI